jgi:hypothetical protein
MPARLRIWREVIWHGGLSMIAFLLGAPVSLFFLVRDEVLPDRLQRKLHLSALPSLSPWVWIVVLLVLFTLLVLEGTHRVIDRKDREIEARDRRIADYDSEPRPLLEADDPFVRLVRMNVSNTLAVNTNIQIEHGTTTAKNRGASFVRPSSPWDTDSTKAFDPPSQPEFYAAVARIRNDPPKHRDARATAGKAITELTFFEIDNGEPRTDGLELTARWSDNEQPGNRPLTVSIADLRSRDLEPNGDQHLIDVALKYLGDDAMYAFNDESIRASLDWRDPRYKLTAEYYRVHLRVTAMNMNTPFHCDLLLHNLGRGKSMEITRWQSIASTADSQGR